MNEVPNTEVNQPVGDAQPDVKVMQQHEINALVGGAKQKGFDKGYQQAKAELMAQMPNSPTMQAPMSLSHTAMQSADEEARLRRIATEELSKQRDIDAAKWKAEQESAYGTKILNDLNTKSSAAKTKFEDYDKVVKPGYGNFVQTPEVLLLANQFDNSGEMLYDMAKNPGKIAQIAMMSKLGMNDEAYSEMKKLSDSIKVNEMSANQPKPKMPLSQINPSNVGVGKTDDNLSSNHFRGDY